MILYGVPGVPGDPFKEIRLECLAAATLVALHTDQSIKTETGTRENGPEGRTKPISMCQKKESAHKSCAVQVETKFRPSQNE